MTGGLANEGGPLFRRAASCRSAARPRVAGCLLRQTRAERNGGGLRAGRDARHRGDPRDDGARRDEGLNHSKVPGQYAVGLVWGSTQGETPA